MLAELGIAIPVGLEKALQMARQIVDGEVDLDLPVEATTVVAMLSGQMLQLHVQLRKLDFALPAYSAATIRRAAWQRSPVSGLLARQRLPHRLPTQGSSPRGVSSQHG